jgi:rhodanese-related sulfurtransferase
MRIFSNQPNPLEVDVAQAETLVASGEAVLVDIREDWEWQRGHAAPARHIPMDTLGAKAKSLPRDREVLLICASGNRSLRAAKALANQGLKARSVAGGTAAWARQGLALTH